MKRIYTIAIALFCLLGVFGRAQAGSFTEGQENVFSVKRVIDGDSIRLASRRKVRLLGVDAPELHRIDKIARESSRYHVDMKTVRERGEQAYRFLNDKIGTGKVRLAYDWVKRDNEGSILAYVYLEDGTLLNAAILSEGLAYFDDSYPFQHQDDFKALEEEACQKGLGLWADNK